MREKVFSRRDADVIQPAPVSEPCRLLPATVDDRCIMARARYATAGKTGVEPLSKIADPGRSQGASRAADLRFGRVHGGLFDFGSGRSRVVRMPRTLL